MKKILLYTSFLAFSLASCSSDDDSGVAPEVSIEERNRLDDAAIKHFLEVHYLDAQGEIKAFNSNDTSDDGETKLADLNPQKTPSGAIYIVRSGAQPAPGEAIRVNDKISIMHITRTYIAQKNENGQEILGSTLTFRDTVNGGGTPDNSDKPGRNTYFYRVPQSVLNSDKSYERSAFEIEGFNETLSQYFTSFNMMDEDPYNLQGVIIVPSRLAFARDKHYNYTGYSLRDRCFVFNFQIYKRESGD